MIYKRVVSTKRHTLGYMVTGVGRVSRREAVRLAKAGKIKGVRVYKGPQGEYISSNTSRNLYSLPVVVSSETAVASSRSRSGNDRSRSRNRSR
jgi:hypothetical protein